MRASTGTSCAALVLVGNLVVADEAFAAEPNLEVSLEANASRLSGGFDTQVSQLLNLAWTGEAQSRTQLGLEHKRAFGERATIAVASYARDVSALDRVGFAFATSDAQTIAARWRVDGQYSRKLGQQLDIVASVGGFVSSTADGHRDSSVIPSVAWYFADRQVLEAGVRLARSDPGAQKAARGFAVYTWTAQLQDTISVRAEAGREAYQSLGANAAVANFASQELALAWRHWSTPTAGLGLNVAAYSNPLYRKNTFGLVAFASF